MHWNDKFWVGKMQTATVHCTTEMIEMKEKEIYAQQQQQQQQNWMKLRHVSGNNNNPHKFILLKMRKRSFSLSLSFLLNAWDGKMIYILAWRVYYDPFVCFSFSSFFVTWISLVPFALVELLLCHLLDYFHCVFLVVAVVWHCYL